MTTHYDAIVLGTGAMGSAALWRLARRGLRVLGLEQFGPAHDRGSSHGQTRIIRQAYFEHPDYVPLLLRAYEVWHELAEGAKAKLFEFPGLLQIGRPEGEVIPGILRTAQLHGLAVEKLSPSEIARRFSAFRADDEMVGLFEARAGFLRVERCVSAMLDAATAQGAVAHFNETVQRWAVRGSNVEVETDRATYACDRLVVSAGAWAGRMLADVGLKLEVLRKPQLWYRTTHDALRVENGCPAFLYETAEGIFYGFPAIDSGDVKADALKADTVKVAEHTGGAIVADPSNVDRQVTSADRERIEAFTSKYLRGVSRQCTRSSVCMYTMTPDARFVIDLHPRWPQVAFVAGLSGHGFKFAPVLGEALADLVATGTTALSIEFLRLAAHGGGR
ncbi:MAG TPA: N-methyl-L-tryptophan oxidase [Pirellulales bacterium]|nr:N-methyl-L-tryptophan oxidase [Pirellulales bacterium]